MKRITIQSTLITLLTICFVILILGDEDCTMCYTPSTMMLKVFTCGIVLLIGSIYFKKKYTDMESVMFDIETLPLLETNEAVAGIPFSCEGTVQTKNETTLTSPYSKTPCVYFHGIKEELRGYGRSRKWVVGENIAQSVPFLVSDERGSITVDLTNVDYDFSGKKIPKKSTPYPDPDKSEVECTVMFNRTPIHEAGLHFDIAPIKGTQRISEYVLTPGTAVFIHGYVTKNKDGHVVHEYPGHPLLVSTKSKEAYIEDFYKGKNLIYFVHVLLAAGFSASVLAANYFFDIYPPYLFIILYLGNIILLGSVSFTIYNRLVTLKERTLSALATIDSELKRRADLIPQVVKLVREFTQHEKDLQTLIAQIRTAPYFQKQMPEKERSILSEILAVAENYPALRASTLYQDLMTRLVDTEERIAYTRTFYNRNVRKYNVLTRQIPVSILAYLLDMKPMAYVTLAVE